MGQFRSYLADIRRDAGSKLPFTAFLVAAGALVEGFGVVAILPFAALITGNIDTEAARVFLSAMEHVGISSELGRGLALGALFLSLLALRAVIAWHRDINLTLLGLRYVDGLRNRLFRAIANARWSAVTDVRRTDIEHAITNDVARLSAGTSQLLTSAAAVAMALVQIGIVAWLAPKLLALVCVLLAVSLLFTRPLIRKAQEIGKKITRAGQRIYAVLGDFMASQKLARLNNAEAQFLDRFDTSVTEVRAEMIEFQKSQIAARLAFQFSAGVVVVGALLIGFFVLATPLSVLTVTLVVLARLASPIQKIAQTSQSIANTLPAYSALQDTIERLRTDAVQLSPESNLGADLTGPAALKLSDVTFTHQSQSEPTLTGATLAIAPGEIVALSGASGAGKTTLLDIICGLHHRASGTIHVGERELAEHSDLRWWRSQLAYLPQDPFLFDASLRENLCWSAADCADDDIWSALETAGAASLVRALPDGLASRAGERGQSLSGGERQRLCITRALLRKPRLLILDEATSALDAALEDEILTRLAAKRQEFSILIVTHRSDTLRHADRILHLADGKIVAR